MKDKISTLLFLVAALVVWTVGNQVGHIAFGQVDQFPNERSYVVDGPANDATAVTESDSTVFDDVSRAMYCGTGGTLVVTTRGGTVATFTNVPDGGIVPIRATKLMAASTVASVVNLHD